MRELVNPEMFKDIRSCRLMRVYQHNLTVSVFRDRRIKFSYTCTNTYRSTRHNITEYMRLHPTISVLSRIFLQMLIFTQVGTKFPACLCTQNFHYLFHKAPTGLHSELDENIWHDDISNCVLKFEKYFLISDNYLQNLFLLFYFSPTWRFAILINKALTYLLLNFEP